MKPPAYEDVEDRRDHPTLDVNANDKFGTQAGTMKAIAAKQVNKFITSLSNHSKSRYRSQIKVFWLP